MGVAIAVIIVIGSIAFLVMAIMAIKDNAKASEEMEGRIHGLKYCERCGKEFEGQGDKKKDLLTKKIVCNNCAEEFATARDPSRAKKNADEIRCPKCNSNQITADGKKLSGGRAVAGAVLAGPAGAVLGGLTGKKVRITCLNCGHSWTAGKKK